jgi:DNA-binding protein HU-beta
MATNRVRDREDGAERVMEALQGAERAAIEAVRKFLDAVDGALPHTLTDARSRKRIIDSAFKMTEEFVGTSNDVVQRLVKAGADAAGHAPAVRRTAAKKAAAKKAAVRKTAARKAPARKSTAKKAPARKSTAKKAPARKSTAKKSAARKAPARKTA